MRQRDIHLGATEHGRGGLGPLRLLPVIALLAAVAACQDRDEAPAAAGAEGSPETAASPIVPPGARDALTPAELAGIDVASIRLTLPWNSGQTNRPGTRGAPTLSLEGVETSTLEGLDRLTLHFSDGPDLPGYQVEYVETPVDRCGQGRPVESEASAFLRIRLDNVQAHDPSGAATFGQAPPRTPGFPRVRSIHLTCDAQAVVEWVLGLAAETSYRVLEVRNPQRLVVDVRD